LALSVPLSRFTSRVGGGSAFYVRRYESLGLSIGYNFEHGHLGGWDVDRVLFGFGVSG